MKVRAPRIDSNFGLIAVSNFRFRADIFWGISQMVDESSRQSAMRDTETRRVMLT